MPIMAVVVTYHPDLDLLAKVLHAVTPQVEGVVIVENGSQARQDIAALASLTSADLISNDENRGIAAAQNQGVACARTRGFTHVLLLDQDTILAPGVVADLSRHLDALGATGRNVGAIGPAYDEVNSQRRTRAYQAGILRVRRIPVCPDGGPMETDFIIASGSLIPLAVLDAVGPFNDALFIDAVDTEWCFRAKAAGFPAFLAPSGSVDHRLGAGTVGIGPLRVAVHVPIRNYYWVRNALWLARQRFTPLAWRLYFVSRCVAFLLVYPIFADTRAERLRLIGRGLRDGMMGRLGKFDP